MAEPWFDDEEEEEIDLQEELELPQDDDLPSSTLDEASCTPLHHDDDVD